MSAQQDCKLTNIHLNSYILSYIMCTGLLSGFGFWVVVGSATILQLRQPINQTLSHTHIERSQYIVSDDLI